MSRNVFLFFLLLSLVVSCDDKDVSPSIAYPSTYYKSGVESGKGFKVYTVTGEVKDRAIVEKFMATDTVYFNQGNHNLAASNYYMDSVKFLRSHEAVIFQNYSNVDCILHGNGGLIVATQKDTIAQCCSVGDILTRTFDYEVQQVKPIVFSENIYSSTRGNYLFTYTGQPQFILMKYNGKLVAPMTEYIVHATHNFRKVDLNNIVLPDFYKYLEKGDTLTLTNSFITFELKK